MSKGIPEGWKKIRLDSVLLSIESGRRPTGGVRNINDGIHSLGGEHISPHAGFVNRRSEGENLRILFYV